MVRTCPPPGREHIARTELSRWDMIRSSFMCSLDRKTRPPGTGARRTGVSGSDRDTSARRLPHVRWAFPHGSGRKASRHPDDGRTLRRGAHLLDDLVGAVGLQPQLGRHVGGGAVRVEHALYGGRLVVQIGHDCVDIGRGDTVAVGVRRDLKSPEQGSLKRCQNRGDSGQLG